MEKLQLEVQRIENAEFVNIDLEKAEARTTSGDEETEAVDHQAYLFHTLAVRSLMAAASVATGTGGMDLDFSLAPTSVLVITFCISAVVHTATRVAGIHAARRSSLAWLAVPLLPLTEAIALAAGVHLFGARRPARIYLLSSAQRFTASMASLALVSSGESPQVMGRRAARASWVGLVLGAGFAFVHDGASRLGGLVTAAAGSATWAAWATWALLAAAIAYAAWTARSMFEVVHLAPSRNVLAGALQIGYPGLEGTAAALGVELPVRGKVELVEDTRTSTPLLAEKCGTA